MKRLLLILALLAAAPTFAQQPTVVTGTITDVNGVPYSFAKVSAQLIPTTASPTIPVGGIPVQIGGQQNANADINGTFSMNLFCNVAGGGCSLISPAGTQWQFTVTTTGAPPPLGTGPQSCSATITITGVSQSVTANFAACPALGKANSGVSYIGLLANLPTTCTVGQLAFVTDASPAGNNLFQATSAGPPCTWTQPPDNTLSGLSAIFTNPQGGHVLCFNDPTHIVNCFVGIPANNQTGASYPVATGDKLTAVNRSNVGAMSDTIAQAGSAGFPAGWAFYYENTNAAGGTNATLTATISTFVGASGTTTLTVIPGERCLIVSDGTNYQTGCGLLTHDHSDAAHGGNIPPASITGTAAVTANVQIFTTTGTWTKPSGTPKMTVVRMIAGGGAGGPGFTSATAAGGAGGGSPGCVSERTFVTSVLGATETVTVGTAGIHGGAAAGISKFGNWIQADAGNVGASGTSTTAAGGTAGTRSNRGCGAAGGAGGSGAATNAGSNGGSNSGTAGNEMAGGGAGGASSNGTTTAVGGTGASGDPAHGNTMTGGTAGTSPAGNGGNGTAAAANELVGGGGGGGGGSAASAGTGGTGGNGGNYGGGGGGGGGGGVAGGVGGDGAAGLVIVITYF